MPRAASLPPGGGRMAYRASCCANHHTVGFALFPQQVFPALSVGCPSQPLQQHYAVGTNSMLVGQQRGPELGETKGCGL